jgi:Xaa-Pro aminopeptidase
MRQNSINSYLFEKNRQKLSRRLPVFSLAILVSNDEMPRSADQFFPFRQNSDLYYLTGIELPRTILCICPDYPDHHYHEILFIEKPNEHQKIWLGNNITRQEASAISGINNVFWLDEFEKILSDLMQHCRNVYLTYHENARSVDEVPTRDARFTEKIKNLYPLHSYERLGPIMAEHRQIKEPEEIELIKNAIDITGNAFNRIAKIIKPGISEYEIEAEIIHDFIKNGSSGHAFLPIIASGENSCILHYTTNKDLCKDGDLVLIDFGAEYANYNADITRTLPVNGVFTKRQRQVYEAVLRIHKKAVSQMKPGMTFEKLNIELISIIEEELVSLRLFAKTALQKQNPEKPLYRKYTLHGISHFLGIDVHDAGNKSDALMPGMVITCEPGIYIMEEGLGIRLENDILITSKGNTNLSEKIPLEANEIEQLMKSSANKSLKIS